MSSIVSTPAKPAYAAAPFDHPKADIILRSSDNVDFRIFKLFLSLASPFFETLFDIPQPAEANKDREIKDGLAVVPVTENRKTLDALLRFCYPSTLADDPNLEILEDVIDVLQAAKKYSLFALEKKIGHTLSNPKILEAEPLRCFAIARRGQLTVETRLAAKHTLSLPLIPSWFKEIDLISAADLLVLLTYHRKCGDAAYELKTDMSWIKSHYGSKEGCAMSSGNSPCSCSKAPSPPKYQLFRDSLPPLWWEEFMEEMFAALREKPCSATVESVAEKTKQGVKNRRCRSCSASVSEGMRDLSKLWVKKLNEVISQIELDFDLQRVQDPKNTLGRLFGTTVQTTSRRETLAALRRKVNENERI